LSKEHSGDKFNKTFNVFVTYGHIEANGTERACLHVGNELGVMRVHVRDVRKLLPVRRALKVNEVMQHGVASLARFLWLYLGSGIQESQERKRIEIYG
jgi:hypothetical protein